ncbi:MAG: AI-2E family transporter [Flexilinea sp.]|nr:AI-2E family transporter [Flexilinea sp.]
MDLGSLFSRFSETINKNRPAEPEPVVFVSSDENEQKVIPNRSPRWQRSTKRTVIIGLVILSLIILFFLRSMITPLLLSWLMVFYLKPLVRSVQKKFSLSYKWAVIIVFGIFLLLVLGILTAGGFSLYGQVVNFFDLLNNSMDSLPDMIINILGGEDTTFGGYFARWIGTSANSELNQQVQSIIQSIGGSILSFVQSFSSKIGWFFFVYGFSYFIVWESGKTERKMEKIPIPGYEYDIEMGGYHLSLIWRRFLWGQAMLMLMTLVIYLILFWVLRVRYAFILACGAALTQLVPYIGSFFAWAAVALVTLFQGTTIFGMAPVPYAVLVVGLAFLIDKFKDGFIQPKFMAETLRVHPAAVLVAALICARLMGFLGIFLAAPLVATLELAGHYVLCKLRDEDPWEGIQTVEEPPPLGEYAARYKVILAEKYDKILNQIKNLRTRSIGGKGHGSNGN